MVMKTDATTSERIFTDLLSISLCSIVTSMLNIVHTTYILKGDFTAAAFLIPPSAGIIFGAMLAHIKLLGKTLKKIAYTDSLTHIYNRLHFAHFLDIEIDKVKRYGSTFSIIFFDLDHFKMVNDTFGHLAGDEVLEKVTQIVSSANRSADIFARYGGEEFIILTPETDLSGALSHAERLRRDIESHHFKNVGQVTCSFGVTEFIAESDNVKNLLKRVDNALYLAKHRGRNRVEKA